MSGRGGEGDRRHDHGEDGEEAEQDALVHES
jgi:hypothetical protein